MVRVTIAALVLLCLPAPLLAGSLAGTIRDEGGAGLPSMEVRLWQRTDKGFEATYVIESLADGTYAFSDVAAGDYKLDARMGVAAGGGNWGDRWYDVEEPISDGWIKEDADVIAIADDSDLTGYDLTLLVLGGLDGRVVDGSGQPIGNLRIRVERASERRIHHNDVTKPAGDLQFPGQFFMRGMVPASDYRIIVYDPSGIYETLVLEGPYQIDTATNTAVGDITLVAATVVDPYEANDSDSDPGSNSVDSGLFRQDPPAAFATTGAFVGTLSDTDRYCFDAVAGDRFLISADAFLVIGGVREEHPYTDPVVGIWTGGNLIAHNDDVVLGSPDSFLDVEIDTAGRHCVIVSTYPDVAFTGAGQDSTGPYDLEIELGNRRPAIATTIDGNPTPQPPAMVTIDEGQTLQIDASYSDPDGDTLAATVEHIDNLGAAVAASTWVPGAESGTFTWTASQTAATGSPYTITFTAADSELSASSTVIVEVRGVNLPPSRPVQLAPVDGAKVTTLSPELRVENSIDVDEDELLYQLEIHRQDDGALVASVYDLVEGTGGETTWVTSPPLEENQRYEWRVRAFDGQVDNPYSSWSAPEWKFQVDVTNDPPTPPVLVKPDGTLTVLVRAPTLEAQNPTDPDDEDLSIEFEIAADDAFEFVVASSGPVPVVTSASATTWQADPPLDWGTTYWARASGLDARGGVSEPSNVQQFQIRANGPPPAPRFGPPFHEESACRVGVAIDEQLPVVVVVNVTDPDNDPVTLILEIFGAAANPETDEPLTSASRPQASGATTKFVMDPIEFQPGELYVIRVAANDGFMTSAWTECSFSPPGSVSGADGCDCAATPPAWLLLVPLVWRRARERPEHASSRRSRKS